MGNPTKTTCASCGKALHLKDWPFCPHGSTDRYAQNFTPIVVHKDKHGNYSIPGASDAPLRPGYERVELRNMREVRRVSHAIGMADKQKFEEYHAGRDQIRDLIQKENRAELNNRITSNMGREFMRVAIERSNNRQRKSFDPQGAYFDVAEMDRSNRTEHRDERTGWKSRRD